HQRRLKCRLTGLPELYVSLSHSGDWIAAAISVSAIGIDIETYGKQRDFIAIASHVFSEPETSLLKSLAPDRLNRQFYLYWTLKECVAKQYGDGLKFEVSRAHTFIPATEPVKATIFSWQCPEYVLALAGKANLDIETVGLCQPAEQLRWQNVAA
ncbi:MAG: 4'-phosphopantetheinyl transferase family protein, partial [Arenimonas sp.]